MSKTALDLLKTNKSVVERAEQYAERIKTSLYNSVILPLKNQIDKLDDEIFDLKDFSLDTNLNRGQKKMTKEDCESRFVAIIEKEFEKDLLKAQYESKLETYNAMFVESEETED